MVTYSQLDTMDTSKLSGAAETSGSLSRSLSSRSGEVLSSSQIPEGMWSGTDALAAGSLLRVQPPPLDEASDAFRTGKVTLEDLVDELQTAKSNLDDAKSLVAGTGITIGSDGTVTTPPTESGSEADRNDRLAREARQIIDGALRKAENADQTAVAALIPAGINVAGPQYAGPPNPGTAGDQAQAFYDTVGRMPESRTDWLLAEALDPTSRQDKNGGQDAVVAVGNIEPRPGEGMVRIGLYIPTDEVFNVPNFDMGDDRGMDPNFGPEDTRVSLYVDYETGTVLARQNPSVDTDGEVRVDTPDIQVQETTSGAVRIQYDAANPFGPPGSDVAHTVNGDITVTPGPNPSVDGVIGDYPAFEAYHESNDGTTETLVQDEADNGGALGPILELPGEHEIGDGREAAVQFDRWRHISGEYWERSPEPGAPVTELGDPSSPPDVESWEPFGGDAHHPEVEGVPSGPVV